MYGYDGNVDIKCPDGCPHLVIKKPNRWHPPTGYCDFYDEWLEYYDDNTNGYEACDACLDDSDPSGESEEPY